MTNLKKFVFLALFAAAALLVSACSSQAPGTKADDMSAEEHQRHAEEHQKVSDEHEEEYDPGARRVREDLPADPTRQSYRVEVYNPTERHGTSAEQHKRHAEQHRQAAQELLTYEQEQCAHFPEETRSTCPLMGQIEAVEDVEGGARITFYDDVPLQAAVDHMRCHFAFARSVGREGMDSCPLYLEGVSIEVDTEGHAVTLETDNSEDVESLRERSAEHAAH